MSDQKKHITGRKNVSVPDERVAYKPYPVPDLRLAYGFYDSTTNIPRKRQAGAPQKKKRIFLEAKLLREKGGLSWPKIAQRLDRAAFAKNPRNAAEAMRRGVERLGK